MDQLSFKVTESPGPSPGSTFETCTVTHQGRDFTAGGAYIDREGGVILAYVRETAPTVFDLVTWEGRHIAPLKVTGRSYGFHGSKITHFRTIYDGHYWSGKLGLEWNQLVTMRRGRAVK